MRVCVPGRGRVSPCAEFNFFNDPEAAFIVLASMSNIRLLPYEVCCRHNLSWVKNHFFVLFHKFCFISNLQMLILFCFCVFQPISSEKLTPVYVVHFYMAPFSTLKQTHYTLVTCDSKWVTCHFL